MKLFTYSGLQSQFWTPVLCSYSQCFITITFTNFRGAIQRYRSPLSLQRWEGMSATAIAAWPLEVTSVCELLFLLLYYTDGLITPISFYFKKSSNFYMKKGIMGYRNFPSHSSYKIVVHRVVVGHMYSFWDALVLNVN